MRKVIELQTQHENQWNEVSPGVFFCVLRKHGNSSGQTALVRMKEGAYAPLHDHAGGEETYILSGALQVGETLLKDGDYLYTPPGIAHDGKALRDTLFLAVLPEGLQLKRAG